ncbi:MAG TPA: DUF4097 family beta strand repeat-containing protein [Candidatus Polarisedimenticolaceae bacterium]|nr:DUF4097 family beta strand repeat-containing protein [Candidatus Polarisedimenticolaceae bacterium]
MLRRANLVILVLAIVAVPALAAPEVKRFPASSGGKLVLDLEAGGTVEISGSGGSGVEVAYSSECTPACEVSFEEGGRTLTIRTAFSKGAKQQNSNVELSIKVPSRFDVDVASAGGGLSIDGVEGRLAGKTSGGELTLRNVRGETELTTMGGEIKVVDCDLDGYLKTMGGAVTFENVVGDVRGSSMGGNVRYHNVRSRGGKPLSPERTGSDLGDLDPETVQISTMGGEINVEEAPEGADLHTMGGDIDVHGARRFVRAKTMGGNIEIASIDGWVQATTMGGNIDVNVTGQGGDVTLTSMSGDIVLSVPAGFGLDLDLEIAFTRNSGKDFKIVAPGSLKQSVTPEWDHDQGSPRKYIRMSGPVNGGGHAVKVRTVNGNIEVKQGA